MDVILKSPEIIICEQGEKPTGENDAIYFIAKGRCIVQIQDKFLERTEKYKVKELGIGSHFGEISMLYHTKRSATVTSQRYLQCARVTRTNYDDLLLLYPNLNDLSRESIQCYDDPLKVFVEMSLNQIEYFEKFPNHVKNEWIYNMERR